MTDAFANVLVAERARAELAPGGVLRAGINMGNGLLVTGRTESGEPDGVSPDMARAIARRLGVDAELVPFASPGELGDAVGTGTWNIALIGTEPQRAERIAFSAAYAEIEATYLVPAGSQIHGIAEVDRPGVRIAVSARSAYGLWLERNIRQATLVRGGSNAEVWESFTVEKLEALAGLRSSLLADAGRLPGSRVLQGRFATVQQAVGTARGNDAGAAFLAAFVEVAKASGFVAGLITKHGVEGRLFVAPVA